MAFSDFLLFVSVAEEASSSTALLSTSSLALRFSISQQSASRKLREFERLGLIARKPTPYGTEVSLTDEGRAFLKQVCSSSKAALSGRNGRDFIAGKVCSGPGKGSYYTSLPRYREQFTAKLGFLPFKGTLNLRTDPSGLERILAGRLPVVIGGFSTKKRSFGSIRCFPALVGKKAKAAIIFPERSNNPDGTIELISPVNLRKELSLTDSSEVKVYFE
jgi:riboflavin kinase